MAESEILHILITIAVLLFAAKLMAKLVVKMGQSAVLGEIIAGIIISPFALGSLPLVIYSHDRSLRSLQISRTGGLC